MESVHVTLKVTQGFIEEKEHVLKGPSRCLIGRADDCDLRLPPSYGHADVSRHHCLIEIEPETVRIRDLGSRNGTFVNGEKIGQRSSYRPVEDSDPREFPAVELSDGDDFQVGKTIFHVQIGAPTEAFDSATVPLYFV